MSPTAKSQNPVKVKVCLSRTNAILREKNKFASEITPKEQFELLNYAKRRIWTFELREKKNLFSEITRKEQIE